MSPFFMNESNKLMNLSQGIDFDNAMLTPIQMQCLCLCVTEIEILKLPISHHSAQHFQNRFSDLNYVVI